MLGVPVRQSHRRRVWLVVEKFRSVDEISSTLCGNQNLFALKKFRKVDVGRRLSRGINRNLGIKQNVLSIQ